MDNEKIKKGWRATKLAFIELYWTYFPLVIPWIVLVLLRKFDKIAETPDMLVISTILFGEGMSKIKNAPLECTIEREGAYITGLTGFVVSLALLTLLVFAENCGIDGLKNTFEGTTYWVTMLCLWIFSFYYGMSIRIKIALSTKIES